MANGITVRVRTKFPTRPLFNLDHRAYVNGHVRRASHYFGNNAVRIYKEGTPTATGRLAGSTDYKPKFWTRGGANVLRSRLLIRQMARYAYAVDRGGRSHEVRPYRLLPYIRLKRTRPDRTLKRQSIAFAAYIAYRGTKPHPYLEKVNQQVNRLGAKTFRVLGKKLDKGLDPWLREV